MFIKPFYPLAVAVVFGCASGGVPDPTITANTRKTNILSAEEIAAAHADNSNLYDAIARLRPNWLAPHGVTSGQSSGVGTEYALVYVDGQNYGDLSTLRSIPAHLVGAIRYYDITQAGARFGIRGGASGVIEVMMKQGR
jgi:hypothetical protein